MAVSLSFIFPADEHHRLGYIVPPRGRSHSGVMHTDFVNSPQPLRSDSAGVFIRFLGLARIDRIAYPIESRAGGRIVRTI
jgi:hypothetical protein